jgi:large subunit ribosomal protein L25
MADQTSTQLAVSARQPDGSRAARRTRRDGRVPGILYGGGEEPLSFEVDARELRLALAKAGAVLDLSVDGGATTPVVLKEAQRHPVRGETVHVDLLRVRLDKPIQAVVALELADLEESPGVREGGVLEQITRELNIEALPGGIPESIVHSVAEMNIGETLLDPPEETVLATLTPPRLQSETATEIEAETEVVGEAEKAEGADGGASEE